MNSSESGQSTPSTLPIETGISPSAYLAGFAATLLGATLLAVALGVLADPYRLFGTPSVGEWTAMKPRVDEQAGLAKTYQLERIKPATVLLGNSRVEIGIDPEDPLWPASMRPVYNAATAGRGIFWASRMYQESEAVSHPQVVFLGLDFADFLTGRGGHGDRPDQPDADEKRLLVDREGRPNSARSLQHWRDLIAGTISIDALADSVATLANLNRHQSVTMTEHGFNPMFDYPIYIGRIGHYGLFKRKDAAYEEQFKGYLPTDFVHSLPHDGMSSLREILEDARRDHVRVIAFIHPYHQRYYAMIERVGLWPTFEAWKRRLSAEAEADRQHGGDVTVYDFSGINAVTTEAVPADGDTSTSMHWYWESGHYKSALGHKLLERMLGDSSDFGILLTPATLESDLESMRRDRRASGAMPESPASSAETPHGQ